MACANELVRFRASPLEPKCLQYHPRRASWPEQSRHLRACFPRRHKRLDVRVSDLILGWTLCLMRGTVRDCSSSSWSPSACRTSPCRSVTSGSESPCRKSPCRRSPWTPAIDSYQWFRQIPTRHFLSLGVLRKWASFFISLLISLLGIYMHPDLSSVPRSADVTASSEWRPKPRWSRGSPETYAHLATAAGARGHRPPPAPRDTQQTLNPAYITRLTKRLLLRTVTDGPATPSEASSLSGLQ